MEIKYLGKRPYATFYEKKLIPILIKSCLEHNIDARIWFKREPNFTEHYEELKQEVENSNFELEIFLVPDYLLGFPTVLTDLLDHDDVLFLSAMVYPEIIFPEAKNKPITIGGDILFGSTQWPRVASQSEKNLDSPYHWMCYSNSYTPGRLLMATYILDKDICSFNPPNEFENGLLSFRLSDDVKNFKSWSNYVHGKNEYMYLNPNIEMKNGFRKILKGDFFEHTGDEVYGDIGINNNPANFDINLRERYKNSLVEIVNETLQTGYSPFITEKYQQSIYGFTLPILNASQGTVKHLREIGFNMFDDYIDHSYDDEEIDWRRATRAINDNIELLQNKEKAIDVWNKCKPAMIDNYNYVRYGMYDYFETEFKKNINRALDEFKKK